MLLSVLAISGTFLAVSAIAGLLMIYQIRRTTDFANSAKAIFAADAGVEAILYNKFNGNCIPSDPSCPVQNPPGTPIAPSQSRLGNGAVVILECYKNYPNNTIDCFDPKSYKNPPAGMEGIKSVGRSVNSYRAFLQRL